MVNIANLTFGYSRKQMLFENLSLKLEGGHIYGLLGKNGAGKSTLLKAIAGLVFPAGGTCEVSGMPSSKRLPQMLQDLYFVPEEIYVPPVTISEYVKSTSCFYPKFDQAAFGRYLSEFEVPENSVLTKLSFGQQKKALISFGLACCTATLIMDEPTNGLDIPSKIKFRKIVATAFSESRSIIISTHQVRDLDNLIDTVVILDDNRIVLNMSLDDISDRLVFGTIGPEDEAEALYTESTIRGMAGILHNTGGSSTRVDIELLFNAVTGKNEKVLHLINERYEQSV